MSVAKIRTSIPQTIPTGFVTTVVNLDAIEIPATGTALTAATGSKNILVNKSGTYLITWEQVAMGTGYQITYVTVNGTPVPLPGTLQFDQGGNPASLGKTIFLSLAAGSVVGLVASQNSGTGSDLTATLAMVKVS